MNRRLCDATTLHGCPPTSRLQISEDTRSDIFRALSRHRRSGYEAITRPPGRRIRQASSSAPPFSTIQHRTKDRTTPSAEASAIIGIWAADA